MPTREVYPSFSLVLTAANGNVVKLKDFQNAVSRGLHIHLPTTQLPPPLLLPPAALSSSLPGTPTHLPPSQASAPSPSVASSSSNGALMETAGTRFEGRVEYTVEYEVPGTYDSRPREAGTTFEPHTAHPVGERRGTSSRRVGLLRRFAAIFSALYRKLCRFGVDVACRMTS